MSSSKCSRCGKTSETGNFCTRCGVKLEKEKIKFSGVTIISFGILSIIAIAFFCLITYSFYEATVNSNEAYGWMIFIVMIAAFMVVPYYLVILVISIVCDKKIKKHKLIKNILLALLLLLPFLWMVIIYVESEIDSNKKEYEYSNISLTFPETMNRISTSTDFEGNYDHVSFYEKGCTITFAEFDYREELSLIENFKEYSDRFTYISAMDKSIYEDFNINHDLYETKIQKEKWYLYEKEYDNLIYKFYGLKIDDNFYKIEIKDKNTSICKELTQEIFSSIKYY